MAIETTPFDMAEMLDSEDVIREYFAQVWADGDSSEIVRALGHIARTRGMARLAEDTGIGRVSLYKALSPNAHPRFDTILKVTRALGLNLTVSHT
ncbi:MAG: putative addiction module antidote protein [Zoogloeaceae bacterium]|jgi:probable addiction module antidote protein|nr:putative addiction module antidote protein [Zoogloeaceae bacterium]